MHQVWEQQGSHRALVQSHPDKMIWMETHLNVDQGGDSQQRPKIDCKVEPVEETVLLFAVLQHRMLQLIEAAHSDKHQ